MYLLFQATIKIIKTLNICGNKLIKSSTLFSSRLSLEEVVKGWELLKEEKIFLKLWNPAKESPLKLSRMTELLLKSILLDLATLRFKFLVINSITMFIFMREIVQSKEDIRKLLKKLLQTFLMPSDNQFVNRQWMQLEPLDITMQEQLNSFSIWIQTNIISWKWIPDFKWSIQFLKWLQVKILCNGNF